MPDMQPPRYSLMEIERRWLVPAPCPVELASRPYRIIEDTYLDGTLLRLRCVREPGGAAIYKLGKKYGPHGASSQPITNIYLSPEEYRVFSALPGARVEKRRYAVENGAIDIYPAPLSLSVFEIEFPSGQAAADYVPPAFVAEEITGQEAYSGAALAIRFKAHLPEHRDGA